ncbi:MAG: transcription termination/antitermination protein NusA [Dehalococcoidia bacterium]|nr:MAG: transcription termination/antitermination protein NusA [Dehalococcoidia bacterium]
MKTDFLLAITQLAAERNLPKEVVFAAVEAALVTAFKKDEIGARQNISVKIHPVSGDVKVYTAKIVVEEPTDTYQQISLAEARKLKKDAQLDEIISFETTSLHGGRIAAQTAKQVVLQRLREAEREFIFGEYIDREGDIVSGVVHRIEPRQVVIDLGKAEGVLPGGEQVRNERYRVGQRLKLYLVEVNRTNRGPRLILSRSHPNLVRRLFELEVPEIYNGNVELKAVAREAGYRSKVAVAAKLEGLDPVGSCVGLRGVRIQNVVNELNGERIDVIQWDADPNVFIANALSPAQVVGVDVDEAANTAVVVVPDGQLSLAIGKEGQNARLAARLTGWRIDIKSASAAEAAKITVEKEKAAVPGAAIEEKVEKRLAVAVPREQYKIPLEQLGLSGRTFNLLLGSGIAKVGQLLEKDDKDLLGLRGFGQKSLSEVKERLGALDLGPPPLEEIELPTDEVETIAEEVLEPVEEEVELVPYEPTPEEVEPSEKPQIRFAEDIFGAKPIGVEIKKKSKKKPSREEKLEDGRARRGRRAAALPVADEYDELSEEGESQ